MDAMDAAMTQPGSHRAGDTTMTTHHLVIAGHDVQIDLSGQGHAWRPATEDDCPANIQDEIAAEILDGGLESCDDYAASNGLHYRWS